MKKKGFTLIELLATITLLALVSLITFTTVSTFVKRGKEDLYQDQLNNVKLAAKAWASNNKDIIADSECYTITLGQLQDSSYIDDNIKNPLNGGVLDKNKIFVNITKENDKYAYEVSDDKIAKCPKAYNAGNKIIVGGEKYLVIEDSDYQKEYVVALKEEHLTEEEVNLYGGSGTENNHVNRYVYYLPGISNSYGRIAYYSSPLCGYKEPGSQGSYQVSGCTKENATNYDTSDIKYVIDNWASTQFTDGELKTVDGYSARLITFEELQLIGWPNCASSDVNVGCPKEISTPDWIWNFGYFGGYWTMSPRSTSAEYVWSVTNDGRLSASSYVFTFSAVRPVINVYKWAIEDEGGNNNEE